MVFAAGLLADAVENMQTLGWLPSGHVLWDSSRIVAESSSLGDVFHSLLGYADHPTVLQAVVVVGYLAVSLTAFVWLARRSRRQKPGATGAPATSTAPSTPTSTPGASGSAVPS
jgi:high-affinity iron transporter